MKKPLLLSLALVAALSACATQDVRNPLAIWHASPNHNERGPVVIVLHTPTRIRWRKACTR